MRASYGGHTDTVRALIGAGADLNLQSKVCACAFFFWYLFCSILFVYFSIVVHIIGALL
jgi:hypothetical protein